MKETDFKRDYPLKPLTTLKVGGNARLFYEAMTIEDLQNVLHYSHHNGLKIHILGKGSNTLFHDHGFDGVVIRNKIDFLEEPSSGIFSVGAGTSFARLGMHTAKEGWSGLEFAAGIPGSVGGAIFMNAGANGSETCDSLETITFIDFKGEVTLYKKEELFFGYRISPFHKMDGAIAAATFTLKPSPEAKTQQKKIVEKRHATQPYDAYSAGCVFRNPSPEVAAAALIDQCGLKGCKIGDIEVSKKHANFMINNGKGTYAEMKALIAFIQKSVKEKTGVTLETEVREIPFEERI